MTKSKSLACVATVLAGLFLTSFASAQDRTLVAPTVAPYSAVPSIDTPKPVMQIKTVSIDEAKLLLSGSDRSSWTVLDVQAAACTSKKTKECKAVKKQCEVAQKFAKKYSKHATCSELYTQTSVLLMPASVAKTHTER